MAFAVVLVAIALISVGAWSVLNRAQAEDLKLKDIAFMLADQKATAEKVRGRLRTLARAQRDQEGLREYAVQTWRQFDGQAEQIRLSIAKSELSQETIEEVVHYLGTVSQLRIRAEYVLVEAQDAKSSIVVPDRDLDRLVATADDLEDELRRRIHVNQVAARQAILTGFGGIIALATILGSFLILPISIRVRSALKRGQKVAEEAHDAFEELCLTKASIESTNVELDRQRAWLVEKQEELQEALEHAENQKAMHDRAARRFQALFDGLPVGCASFDTEGTVFEWNGQLTELTGVPAFQVLLRPLPDAFDEDAAAILQEMVVGAAQGARSSVDLRYKTPEGERTFALSCFPLANSTNEVTGGILCVQDVTITREGERRMAQMAKLQQTVLDSTPDAIVSFDRDGVITGFNRAAERIFGFQAQELIGHSGIECLFLETEMTHIRLEAESDAGEIFAADWQALVHYARPERPVIRETHLKRKDETIFDGRVSVTCLMEDDGEVSGYLLTGNDISQEKTTAERLRMLSLVAEKAENSVIISDPSGRVLFVNPAFERMSGYEWDDALGEPAFEFRSGLQTSRTTLKFIIEQVRQSKPVKADLQLSRKDGSSFWVRSTTTPVFDPEGRLTHLVTIEEDISDRKADEARILESEERLRQIVEAAGEFIWETDANWNITYVSDRVETVLGFSSEEIMEAARVGDELGQLVKVPEIVEARMAAGDPTSNITVCTKTKDGRDVWLRVNVMFRRDAAGILVGYRGASMDITAEKLAQDALSHTKDEMQRILESINDPFIALDSALSVRFVNRAALKWLNRSQPYVIGRQLTEVFDPSEWVMLSVAAMQCAEAGVEREFEHFNPANQSWVNVRLFPNAGGALVFLQDITTRKVTEEQVERQMLQLNEANLQLEWQQTELEAANSKLHALATTDGLTGLNNHKRFQDFLQETIEYQTLTGGTVAVALMDVDKFKQYNDNFGHLAGDEVLKGVAEILQLGVEEPHLVARYGGEEFVVVWVGLEEEAAFIRTEELRAAIEEREWPNREVTASFGLAMWHPGLQKRAELIDRADQALYASKESGRNRVTKYSQLQTQKAA